jgi:hypothetical protein
MMQEREPGADAKYRGESITETVNQPCLPNKLVACSWIIAGRHPLCLAVPDGMPGVAARHPLLGHGNHNSIRES